MEVFNSAGKVGPMKEFYTTKEIARICGSSERTIVRRIKSGDLDGFRLAGGKNFRVSRESLVEFLNTHCIPIPEDLDSTRKRILIVDDDETFLRAMQAFFRGLAQFETQVATSGFQAGVAIKSFKPHLIILDIRLGDMDGRELLKVKKQDPSLRDMKILGMSGCLDISEVHELRDIGFDDYIGKPFTFPPLMKLIERLLGTDGKGP